MVDIVTPGSILVESVVYNRRIVGREKPHSHSERQVASCAVWSTMTRFCGYSSRQNEPALGNDAWKRG